MPRVDVDTNLLFGVLALQTGLIEQADLFDAFARWSRNKSRPLAQVLVDRAALSVEDRSTLESLVERHLAKHGSDLERSLCAAAPPRTVVEGLLRIGEPELDASVARFADSTDADPVVIDCRIATAPGSHVDADATTDGMPGLGQPNAAGARFQVLRPHARGGIGMVSVALDAELHREVALKEILPEQAGNLASRGRFLLEAEVTARLEHPGVVPVYGLGMTADGRPYYAMRLVRGETLKEAIDRFLGEPGRASAGSQSPGGRGRDSGEQALELRHLLARFLGVCNTVAYAHSRGVIHRDLKPANIMLGPYGETLVVDWGLAKVVGRDEPRKALSAEATLMPASGSGSSETVQGTVVGTPAYMSPEQAAGMLEAIGPASDVYGLGATLYYLLTGRPPFDEPDLVSLLRKVQRGDFPSPRQIDRRVAPALEAVVKKAMALAPADRYDSATALAGEVDHWLADEPVQAYHAPLWERLMRWARRHKPAVAALAMLLLSAVAALVINNSLIRVEKDRTEQQRRLAEDNFRNADRERRRAESLSANLTVDRGLALCERGEVNRGLLWLAQALKAAPSGEERLKNVLRASLASWSRELTSLKAVIRHPKIYVAAARFRPDGKSLVTADCTTGEPALGVTLWDAATGTALADRHVFEDPLEWVRDGNDSAGWGREMYRDPLGDWISPDGTIILVDDNKTTARLREIATGRAQGAPIPHQEPIVCAAFSPDGSRLVIGGRDKTARVYVAATGAPAGKPLVHGGWVTDVAFSPGGGTILTGSRDGTARLWNAATGEPVLPALTHGKDILRAAFSPDGKTVLTAGFDSRARLWNAITGKPMGKPLVHQAPIMSVAFSPDGKIVLTGSFDRSARLWDAATGEPTSRPLSHESDVGFVTFSPLGRAALTCGDDNSARLWDPTTGQPLGSPLEHIGTVTGAAFSPDGSLLITTGWDFEAQVWDTATSLSRGARLEQASAVLRVAFSPDGRILLVGCLDGSARLYRAKTGRRIGEELHHDGAVRAIAFSPDGTKALTGGNDRRVRLWDTSTGRLIGDLMPQPEAANAVAFSPDGRLILVGDFDGVVRFWDAATLKPTGRTLEQTRGTRIESITFSPDGLTIVTGSDDMTGRLWDAATGQPFGEALNHQGSFRTAAFRPDGKLLVSGGWDKAIRFWDPKTGKPAAEPLMLQSLIMDLALAPDGQAVVVGFADGTARIWDLAARKPISPAFKSDDRVSGVAFRPDGRAVLTGSADGTARVWQVPEPAAGSVERINCWVEVLTRMELSADGMVHVLSAPEWDARRARLAELDRAQPP
ncbi:MAG: protein kinase domain-containing protein [Isosphaeraceae bacterium]